MAELDSAPSVMESMEIKATANSINQTIKLCFVHYNNTLYKLQPVLTNRFGWKPKLVVSLPIIQLLDWLLDIGEQN